MDLSRVESFPTPLINGGTVSRFSYPMGSIWATVPFAPLVPDPTRVAVIIATAITGGIMLLSAPHGLAPLALLALVSGEYVTWGVSALTDPLYVAPLIASIYYWPWGNVGTPNLKKSGLFFGLATAMKQQPWFCAPFLFIWIWKDRDLRSALSFGTIASAVFGLVNLPGVLLSPVATLKGVFTPLIGDGGTMVHLGVGLATLTTSGTFPIAKSAHSLLMILMAVCYLMLYWRYERLRWTAWIAWVPLLFVNYRSLLSYIIPAVVVIGYIYIARADPSEWTTEVPTSAN